MRSSTNEAVVQEYFDSAFATYDSDSSSFFWNLLRRLELRAILSILPSIKGQRLLEACCGSGYYTRILSNFGPLEITAVDLSKQMLQGIHGPNIQTLCGNVNEMTFERKFDLIFCAGGLEFMDEPAEFFKTAARNSKSRSSLIILAPKLGWAGAIYKRFHRLHGIEINLFTEKSLRQLGSQFGWRATNIKTAHPFAVAVKFEHE